MSDASNHFASKTLINKFDCSQAYHCVQMADEKSIQLLAFNFASRTYAYKCLAQGLSKSVTGFSSFIRHYLDPCLAANICTQYMDGIGSAVKNFDELIPNLRKIFECIRKSGLKLSPDKCEIGTQKIKFLGKYITPAGVSTENSKIEKFLKNLRMPQTVKQVKRLVGFLQFWRDFIPNLSQKLMPFYELLKKNVQHVITEKHEENLKILKNDLIKATNLTLRLAKPGLQYVLLCDASYYGRGFVLMIEDYVKTPNKKDRKTYAPVAFGSRLFNIAQLKFSTYYKEFLGLYFALDHFSHFIWGTEKPVIVLTDNKSLTQFFQAKTIPPSLWNCLDRLLSYNLVIAHIPGRANYAADFLSRVQSDLSTTIELKLTDRIPVREIEVQTIAKTPDASLSSIDSIDRMFDQQTTNKNDIFIHQLREQGVSDDLLEQIKQQTKKINQDIDEVQGYIRFLARTEINAVLIPDPNDYLSDLVEQNQPLDLKTEQEKDEVLKRVVKWKEENNVEDLTYASNELKKYRKQFRRLVLRDSILYRKFFDHTGRVQYHQYCLPKHLWKEVVYRLHNSRLAGHLGIVKTVEEFRKRFYFPNFTEYLISVIKNCLTCLQTKLISNNSLKTLLQPISSLQSFPGDMLQIDLVGPFKSPVYKIVLTGIDVFSKYLFAKPLTSASAQKVATELAAIFFSHSYIPHTILSDLGSNFVSDLMHELCTLLEIKLKHATLKHPQTVGVVERSHSALKRILKLNTNEQWSNWHLYVPLAAYIHNTSYYSSIGCTPTSIFHGREPIKPLDIRFNRKNNQQFDPKSDFVTELQDAMQIKFAENKEKIVEAYHKYRKYYDAKANADPLENQNFCLLLNPKLTHQTSVGFKSMQVWLPLYRVEKVLTNSNYLIRKVGTNYTQCVHRIRLRKYEPLEPPVDLENLDTNNFTPDPFLSKYRQEPEIFDSEIPSLLTHTFAEQAITGKAESTTEDAVNISYRYPLIRAAPPFAALPVPERPDPVLPDVTQERVEEPEFPFNEFPILDSGLEEQANQEHLFVDIPQNDQQDDRQENTPEIADQSNQITIQAENRVNIRSPVSENRQQSQKTVRFSPNTQIPIPRMK